MILDQFGREYKIEKKPDGRTIAAAKILESSRDYVSAGLTPLTLASIFRDADGGDLARQAQLFEQLEEKDAHILGEISKRANVILDAPFELEPAGDDAKAQQIADFISENLMDRTDWEDTLVGLQDAVGKGFSANELIWDVSSGQAIVSEFKFIEQRRFMFRDDSGYLTRTPKILTDDDLMGIEIPAWKIVMHSYGGKSGHPTRSAIYRVCAWMYLFKNYAIKDWVIFSEVFGMPLRLGKYDAGASSDDKTALVNAIRSLGTDAAGIISKTTEIEFVETVSKTGSGDLYKALADFCNREISKAILGQTLSADVGDSGSRALGDVHNEVRHDLTRSDARALAATIRDQIIRPMVGFNFGWDAPIPIYKPVWDQDDDLNQKAEWVDKVVRLVQVPAKWLREQFKIPESEGGEELVGGFSQAAPFGLPGKIYPGSRRDGTGIVRAKNLSPLQNADTDVADQYAAQLEQESQAAMDAIIDQVKGLVESAGSLEDIRDQLFDLYPDLDGKDLAEVMAKALMSADLAGRYEINQEVPKVP